MYNLSKSCQFIIANQPIKAYNSGPEFQYSTAGTVKLGLSQAHSTWVLIYFEQKISFIIKLEK